MTATPLTTVPRFRLISERRRVTLSRASSWVILGLFVLVTVLALIAPMLAPYNPIQPVGRPNLEPGSPDHLLGTDLIGRDLFSRTLIGIQSSWLLGLLVVAIGLVAGGVIGAIAGVRGDWLDSALMRFTEIFQALPSTLVAIAVVAALGPGVRNTVLGISIVWWPYYARIIRSEIRTIVSLPHLEAARLSGIGPLRLIGRHVLPGVISTSIVIASQDVGAVVLTLAGLSFLGLGQPAPAPELGADTARGLSSLLAQWWIPMMPGLAVLALSLLATLTGDALRTRLSVR